MGVNLKGKSFLTLLDFKPDEYAISYDIAREVKAEKEQV